MVECFKVRPAEFLYIFCTNNIAHIRNRPYLFKRWRYIRVSKSLSNIFKNIDIVNYGYQSSSSRINSSLTEITSCVSLQNWACLLRGGREGRLSNVLQQETYKYQQPAASGLFSRGGRQGTSRFSSRSKEKGKMVRRKISAIVKGNDER